MLILTNNMSQGRFGFNPISPIEKAYRAELKRSEERKRSRELKRSQEQSARAEFGPWYEVLFPNNEPFDDHKFQERGKELILKMGNISAKQ
jgi:hypothetical protein